MRKVFIGLSISVIFVVLANRYLMDDLIGHVELVDGYSLVDGLDRLPRLEKDGRRMVNQQVVFTKIHENYLVALRLPVDGMSCQNGAVHKIRYRREYEYIIIETSSGNSRTFLNRGQFQDHMNELGLLDVMKIDYYLLDNAWQDRQRSGDQYNFSNCIIVE